MPTGSMFVCTYVRHEMYDAIAQNIQTALVGVNHNRSNWHAYICMLTTYARIGRFAFGSDCCGTANKHMDREALVFAHVCTLTKYVRRGQISSIVNVFDLQFQSQKFDSNNWLVHLGFFY